MNYTIITNNPLVQSTYASQDIIKVKNYIDVLTTARDHVHQGAKLLSHPQAGSIKPYETPYRSVLISNEHDLSLDINSLQHIERAIERFESLSNSMGHREYQEETLKDFQVVDADLIKSAMGSMR